MQEFVDALHREMLARKEEITYARANTLYIGGGTPSQLPTELLLKVFADLSEVISLEDGAEVTIEANPDDVTEEWVAALKLTPVNRISMGLQTFDDSLLCLLHRRHTSRQVHDAVELLRKNGYHNISLDLIYGLPGQTMEMWQRDVKELLAMDVPHLSAYSLQYEEGTILHRMLEAGDVNEVEEELSLAMYEYLMKETEKAGFVHYEISNFAKPGMQSRHNSGYWRDDAYVGLGPGAHSYDGKRRRSWNEDNLDEYISQSYPGYSSYEILTDQELYDEKIMKGLRTCDGVDLDSLSESERNYILKMSSVHLKNGKMIREGHRLRLTKCGIFVSNDIMSDLML